MRHDYKLLIAFSWISIILFFIYFFVKIGIGNLPCTSSNNQTPSLILFFLQFTFIFLELLFTFIWTGVAFLIYNEKNLIQKRKTLVSLEKNEKTLDNFSIVDFFLKFQLFKKQKFKKQKFKKQK